MVGVIANAISVIIGATVGLLAKKAIPESWNTIIMKGMGLISLYIGIRGIFDGENTLVMIFSMVVGAIIGESADIDGRFNSLADRIEKKLDSRGNEESNFAQGFVTSSLLFCVGAMTVVGSLNAGLKGDLTLLLTKTIMDGVSAVMFAASMGIGVLFAAVPVIVIEGGIVLLAGLVEPFLQTAVVNEMTCVGSILIMSIGFNLALDSKLKVLNYMPALFLPIVFCPLYDLVAGLIG
ncbi:MAG: DUF554 domain-containing protein [Clostridia bacterium]|nr:DUF554 domain-containing protein [Clostridia bacterium]